MKKMCDVYRTTTNTTINLSKYMQFFCLMCLCSGNGSSGEAVDQQTIMCKELEREALLTLKKGLTYMPSTNGTNLSSWNIAKDNMECCSWDGVGCDSTTGHVTELTLQGLTGEISLALLELNHLYFLYLFYNDFRGIKIPKFFGSFGKLECLDLSYSNFSGDVPYQLGNLSNLRELYLPGNHLGGPIFWLSNLTLLTDIDLSWNQFEGPFPDLKEFSSLTELYLNNNKLTGQLPTGIGQLSSLEGLDVSFNSLNSTVSDVHFSHLQNLSLLDLSFNSLALNFTPDWIPPFQLEYIALARCDMGPHIPTWLQTQANCRHLDLSSAGISGEVPNWFWDLSLLFVYIDVSRNNMSGLIPDLRNGAAFPTIDISSNNFSGPLPAFHPSSLILKLSQNMFNGTIKSLCREQYIFLQVLDISKNQFSGELPNCWADMAKLEVLNLADNSFSGHLPHSFGTLGNLKTLILWNNKFTGKLPSALSNCMSLELIDFGENGLTGNVPAWIGTLSKLLFVMFGRNDFNGSIPPEICHLSRIQVLDLSHNKLSGNIPHCFDNFTSLISKDGSNGTYIFPLGYTDDVNVTSSFRDIGRRPILQWKRMPSEFNKNLGLLMLIDFSSNKLEGNIPGEFSLLAELISLNLSRNYLTGNINAEINQMKMLEVLDLSGNQLSGEIPIGLTELYHLAVLDLSSNNLSGMIPKSTQLQSFDSSAYAGNKKLCGDPLANCPGDTPLIIDDQKDEGFDLFQSLVEDYFVSAILGFIVGFWVIAGPLLFKRSWSIAYFSYWENIRDWFIRCTNRRN